MFETAHALQVFLGDVQTNSMDMASPKAMERAKQRLEECQKEHIKCPARLRDSILPTRLLAVGSDGDPTIKLHISRPDERGQYLALSYCWGGPQQYKTTEENVADNCQAIQLEKLPQTIQNAISIIRRLGFRYLWIDALCILQDSEIGKHREINHMGAVYRNASLTIVASNALCVSEGFLYNVPATRSFHVPVYMDDGKFASF